MTVKSTVTASAVRQFLNADPKRTAGLSEAALRTLRPGAKGRLHPEVIARHNSRRRGSVYTPGATQALTAEARAEAQERRDALRAKGVDVGTRGPLPKVALSVEKG